MARSFKTPITVDGAISTNNVLASTQSSGDEGGQIDLTKAATNTTLTTGVTIDVYQNKLRFWETGGNNRGYFLDISAGANSVATNIIGTASAVSNTVTGTNSADLVYGNMADNDQFRIRVGGTATNAGFVEIATADDGTEPIYVRQYTGVFTTLARTATLLDGSGNTSFPGTVTGTTFSGSGASLTNVPAANVTGTLTSTVLGNSSLFIGTTSIALNRTTANQALTGITSVTGGTGTTDIALNSAATTAAASGAINVITGATTTSGTTGAIIISSGNSAAASGAVTISTGTATATTGGSLTLSTGNASGTGGISGAISIATGAAGSTGNSGAITMDVGTKTTGSFGTITIGGTNASAVVVGNATNTATANLVSSTSINLNSPAINSNAATLALLATPTTITMGAAVTSLTIAGTSTANTTVNIATAVTTGSKTVNIGTGGTSGSVAIALGSSSGSGSVVTINGTITGAPTAATAATAAGNLGYVGMPQNSQSGAYTLVAGDAGKHIYYTVTGQTVTIPANATVAFQIGTTITFINPASVSTSIAIATDTMYLAGTGTTGTRTLAAYGMATAVKITATTWIISGNGLT